MSIKGNEFSISLKDLICFLGIVLFWLLPSCHTGLTTNQLFQLPPLVTYFHMPGGLFITANPNWPMPHIQVQFYGNPQWKTLPESDYFQMQAFGYRSRLYEILYPADYHLQTYYKIQEELAVWIRKRYIALHQGMEKPIAVRFAAGVYRAKGDYVPQGHWIKRPFDSFSKENQYVISTFYFVKKDR